MLHTTEQIWETMKTSETAKAQSYESRINDMLYGSRSLKSRGSRGNRRSDQPKNTAGGRTSAAVEARTLESCSSKDTRILQASSDPPIPDDDEDAHDAGSAKGSPHSLFCVEQPKPDIVIPITIDMMVYVSRQQLFPPRSTTFPVLSRVLRAAGSLPTDELASTLLVSWLKNINGAADVDVCVRKAAFRMLTQDIEGVVERFSDVGVITVDVLMDKNTAVASTSVLEDLMTILMDDLGRTLFKGLADPAEACR